MTGEEFARVFSDFCNTMNREPRKEAIEILLQEHRTIQQNMMRFFMQYVEGMAKNSFDLRNEASVELAKAIMDLDARKTALPYI